MKPTSSTTAVKPPEGAWFRKFSPVTTQAMPTGMVEQALFQAKNCEKLADLMERVPNENHDQSNYMDEESLIFNRCGTAQCALGWAVVSGKFPGLQWSYYSSDTPSDICMVYMVMNGRRVSEDDVGAAFFGPQVNSDVFFQFDLSKQEVIDRLRAEALSLRQFAKNAKSNREDNAR